MEETFKTQLIHPAVILAASDLNDLDRVMPFAIQMAETARARLLLLHVLDFGAEFTFNVDGMPYIDRENAIACAMKLLVPWRDHAREVGLQCDAIVHEGHPAEEIISAVRQFHADRLLLGTRSRSRLGELLLGSVAEQVLRSTDLPVFTIGPDAHLSSKSKDGEPTVLFATSLGEGHLAGAALASEIAASQHAKLIMLHVLPTIDQKHSTDATDSLYPMVMRDLQLLVDEKPGAGSTNILYTSTLDELRVLAHRVGAESCNDVEIKVLHGNPAARILAEADARRADLIVMHTNEPKFRGIIHDHTIHKVLAHAHCPVITVRSRNLQTTLATANKEVAARG
jgi:nucleotide-binding universal stress UspA family protein